MSKLRQTKLVDSIYIDELEKQWKNWDILWEEIHKDKQGEVANFVAHHDGCYAFVGWDEDYDIADTVYFKSEDEFVEWLGWLKSNGDPACRSIEAAVGEFWQKGSTFSVMPDVTLVSGMARGVIYLDEDVIGLESLLGQQNFRVRTPDNVGYSGMDDEDIARLFLEGKIFITVNEKDFVSLAPKYGFGLIVITDKIMADKQRAVQVISKAIIDNNVWSLTQPFKVNIHPDGTSTLTVLRKGPPKRKPRRRK